MKKYTTLAVLCAFCLALAAGAHAGPPGDKDKQASAKAEALAALSASETAAVEADRWTVFSDNLVRALRSDVQGVRISAMQLIIRYGDRVDVDRAVFDVVRMYRNDRNDDVRRMAVVTLGKMQNPWAMDFLKRSERFEKTPCVRQTIHAVVASYQAARSGA